MYLLQQNISTFDSLTCVLSIILSELINMFYEYPIYIAVPSLFTQNWLLKI